jgi:hypothetical protein
VTVVVSETWTGTNGDPWNASTWAEASASGTGAVTIQAAAGRMVPESSGYGRSRLSMADLADFELLVGVAQTTVTGVAFQLNFRTDTSWSGGDPLNGFFAYFAGGADGSAQSLVLDKIVAGTISTLVSTTYTASGTAITWARVRCVGTNIKVKAWKDGTGEPGTWAIDHTDASFSSGKIGLSAFPPGAAVTVDWDNLTVDDLLGSPHTVLGRHTPGTLQHRNVRS